MWIKDGDCSLKITLWSSHHNPRPIEFILLNQVSLLLVVAWSRILWVHFGPVSLSVGLEHKVLLVSHLDLKRVHRAEFTLLNVDFFLPRPHTNILLHLLLPLVLCRLVVSFLAAKPSSRRCLLHKTCVWVVVPWSQLVGIDMQEVLVAIESGYFSGDAH